jgi:hypothetical protein
MAKAAKAGPANVTAAVMDGGTPFDLHRQLERDLGKPVREPLPDESVADYVTAMGEAHGRQPVLAAAFAVRDSLRPSKPLPKAGRRR